LRAYREKTGHQRLSPGDAKRGLAKWINVQRAAKQEGVLAADRVALLDQVRFAWTRDDERWEYFALKLRKSVEEGGERSEAVARYLSELKRHFMAGRLPEDRRQTLSQLGVGWAAGDSKRAMMVKRLELLARKVGARSLRANLSLDPELKRWVAEQRKLMAAGGLDHVTLSALELKAFDVRRAPNGAARARAVAHMRPRRAKAG
jgi:hypothetical protein